MDIKQIVQILDGINDSRKKGYLFKGKGGMAQGRGCLGGVCRQEQFVRLGSPESRGGSYARRNVWGGIQGAGVNGTPFYMRDVSPDKPAAKPDRQASLKEWVELIKSNSRKGYMFSSASEWDRVQAEMAGFIATYSCDLEAKIASIMLKELRRNEAEGSGDCVQFYAPLSLEELTDIAIKLKLRQIKFGYTFETMDEWRALEVQLEYAAKSHSFDIHDVAEKLLAALRAGELVGRDRKGRPFVREMVKP